MRSYIPFTFRAISLQAAFFVFYIHVPIPPFRVILKTPIDSVFHLPAAMTSARSALLWAVVSLFPHPASFRFHLTMDTLAFGYILPTTGRIRDLHPLEMCFAGRTYLQKKSRREKIIIHSLQHFFYKALYLF